MSKILKRITAFALSVLLVCTSGVTDLLNSAAGVTAKAATTAYVDGEKVVTEALRLLKTPYVWGGTSTSGMDCSGFVYYLLTKKMNVDSNTVPRDTASWARAISNGTLALKDSNGNPISITIKTYSGRYPTASEVEPGTVILQNGHMSICAGTFAGNTGTTTEYGSNFRLNTMLSVRNTLLSKYGSAISNLSTLLTIDDNNNKNFYMHGSYCEESTYNSIWRIEAIGNSSNTASNPGKGISLSNSKSDKNGSATVIATITFDEKPTKGQMYFTKTGAYTQDAVKGATYAVYPSTMSNTDVQKRGTANRITTFTTGSDGSATVSLDAGVYKAIEITAPSGFELSDKVYTVNVATNTTTTQSVTDDEKPFNLRLKKTDSATGKVVTGAEFTVYARQEKTGTLPDGWYESPSFYWKPIGKMTYNSTTGYYESGDLYPVEHTSNYLVRETSAPEGYTLNSKWNWEVKVLAPATTYDGTLQRVNFGETGTYQGKSGSDVTTVENTPKTVTMQLKKTDAATGEELSDAVFTVYERQPKGDSLPENWKETANYYWKPIKDLTYDAATGYYKATGLQMDSVNQGYFRVYETKAPEGYVLNSSWYWEARVLAPDATYTGSLTRINYGETGTYTAADGSNALTNTPETIALKVKKLDSTTGAGLYGATFTAYERQAASGTLQEGWKEADGYYWKPVNTLAYSSNGEYRIEGLQATTSNQGVFRVYETAAPAGYAADANWYWEVQAMAADAEYKGSMTRVDYGTTASYKAADGTNGLNNTPQPFGVSIDKRDADTMAVLDGVTFTVYERAASSTVEGAITADGYAWVPYATLAYNASTQKYDTVVLADGTAASGLQPTKANGGHFRIYETATQDATYVPFDGYWEVAGARSSYMGDDGIQYIQYGTTGAYGEYTDSPYLLNHTDNTDVTVKKVWNDGNNRDGLRPASVTVTLKAVLQDGTSVDLTALTGADTTDGDPFTVVLNSANGWQHVFPDMPLRTEDGRTIIYAISEEGIPEGYTLTTKKSGTVLTAVNTHTPETVTVPVKKIWNDIYNKDGVRPSSITVRLYANGTEINSAVLDSSNSWKYTFTTDADGNPLYRNDKGSAITYTITEDAVGNYTTGISGSAAEGFTVVNTHIPYTSVRVTKTWDDYSNAAGTRPDAITVRLYADGTEINAVQVTAAQNWKYTFTTDSAGNRLEKYHRDGTAISYTITEDAVAGYKAPEISGNAAAGYTIKNTYEEYVEIPVTKVWNDCSDGAGIRPEAIAVRLYADGTGIMAARLNDSNSWQYTFTVDKDGKSLPKYHDDGTPVVYTIEEYTFNDGDLDGYTASYAGSQETGFTITNTHLEYVQVPVEKTWDDKNDAAGFRPDSITVRLYADGTEINSAQVTEDSNGNWSYTFTTDKDGNKLSRYTQSGEPIRYIVNEDAVEGYTTDISEKSFTADGASLSGFSIKNSYREYTEVSVTKTWNDDNDRDGIRPDSITVYLYADGEIVNTATVTADAAGNWSHTFTTDADGNKLEKYSASGLIQYKISENILSGYEANVYATDDAYTFILANKHTPDTTEVKVTKTWDDNGMNPEDRPESITVRLYANGTEINSAVLDSSNSWSYTFTTDADGKPLYKNDNGSAITYTITEDAVDDYTTDITGDAETGFIITNTHIPYASVRVVKTWDDYADAAGTRPDAITVRLYADGTEINAVQVTAAQNWTYTFTKDSEGNRLEKYHADGTPVNYTIKEDAVPGYNDPVISGNAAAGYTIKNSYEEYIEIPVSKVWNDCSDGAGIRPEAIAVRLYADGTGIMAARLNGSNNWKYTFTVDKDGKALPKYHADGTPVVYTIEEYELNDGDLDGYTVSYAGSQEDGFTITNTHLEYVQVPVEKIWDDRHDGAGLRPDSITVRLYADGTEVNAVQVTEDSNGNWSYTFTTDKDGNKLSKYTQNGESIRYTVKEDTVEGYTTDIVEKTFTVDGASLSGFSIRNSYREYTEVSVSKTWNDDNDRDGIRPDSITVYLFADGEIVNTATVTADAAGSWSHTFTTDADGNKLEKYSTNGLIQYTISEEALSGYEVNVNPTDDAYAFILTNKHIPDTTSIGVNKTWNDSGMDEADRPESITVRLYADGVEINSAELTAAAGWQHTFTTDAQGNKLFTYRDNGTQIIYTVSEDIPEGWMADVAAGLDVFEVINTPTVLQVSKQDITTAEEVSGASLEIYAADADGNKTGEALYRWVSTDTPHVIYAIPAGDYVLVETLAPEADGYIKASDVNFTIEETGEVQGVVMKDDYTKVLISKTDMTTGEEIPGAELTITDADGNVVAEWITDGTPHRIDYLAPGEYTLTEVSAPEEDGYVLAESVTFVVEATGEIQKVEMKDDYTKVEISKTDITTGKDVIGAELTITDADGNVIAEWTTDGTPHRIDYLAPGEYTLTEVAAPEEDGYVRTESVTFTVEATGEIQKVEMKDDYTKVEIRKTDFTTGAEIKGAKLTLTDADGATVAEWVTDGTPYRIDYLAPGEYTLTEITAPDGYLIAESITFTVEATGEIQKVEMKDQRIPDTPVLGIEDTFGPYISLLLACAVFLSFCGGMMFLKHKEKEYKN